MCICHVYMDIHSYRNYWKLDVYIDVYMAIANIEHVIETISFLILNMLLI